MSSNGPPRQQGPALRHTVRPTREEAAARQAEDARRRFAEERRLQLLGLLALAAAVLGGTVLYVGPANVFLPGWWRLW